MIDVSVQCVRNKSCTDSLDFVRTWLLTRKDSRFICFNCIGLDVWINFFESVRYTGNSSASSDTAYSRERGHGFEASEARNAAGLPFFFSMDLPEGNYRLQRG